MSMSEWKEYKLGEFFKVKHGFAFSGKYISEEKSEDILVTPGNFKIGGGFKSDKFKYYQSKDYPSDYILKEGDIVVTMTDLSKDSDTLGYSAKIPRITNGLYLHNQRIGLLQFKDNIEASKEFIYWLLRTREYQGYIVGSASGTSIMHTSPSRIEDYEGLFPPLPEQFAIASVLSSLDDKIDLLHRQNATLEKKAETLFRQWFMEETKEEWEEILITDLFEIKDGTHDSPKEKAFGKKLITSKHLSSNSIDFNSAYYISDEDYQQINQRSKVDSGDILFSMIGTIGRIYLEQSDEVNYAIKNIGLFKTSQNPIWTYFTFLWLKSSIGEEFTHEYRSGSTQEYIALGSLRSIVFKVPTISRVEEFNNLVAAYFNKIKTNQQQIHTLTSLRDTLLPKLMSGEVRIV